MSPNADTSQPARERILQTAGELFYRDGYRAVGIDTIVARSGVAKMTLYRHFPGKDDLIAAYLEESNSRFWSWFEQAAATEEEARQKLLAVFKATGELATSPQCLGCAFQATAAEFPEAGHPGRKIARAHKRAVVKRLEGMARDACARDPQELARELLLLMDGAFAAARMFGRSSHASSVGPAAAALIEIAIEDADKIASPKG